MQRSSIDVIADSLEPVLPNLGRMSSPDGAVTLMMSDIPQAELLQEQLGPERWEQLLRDHHELVRRIVAQHDGEVAKVESDGFMASFNSAHSGLHCAAQLQRTFTAGPGTSVTIRAGLHSGFVIANPDQLLGRNVVLAARIAAQAKPGEVLVSSTLKEYTERDPSFHFEPRGEFHFKGMLGEHELFALNWEG